MSQKSFYVKIEPSVLVWARKSIGFNRENAAEKIKISISDLQKYESGIIMPSYDLIEKFSRL